MIDAAILAAIARRLGAALTRRPRPAHALVVDGERLGYLDGARMRRLAMFTAAFVRIGDDLAFHPSLDGCEARTRALEPVTRTLADEGALTAWRDERYAVAAAFGAPPAFLVERAAARYFGIRTFASHANGLVRNADGAPRMWVARRSPTKAIDPSLLDNLIGGGLAAGETVAGTLVREAWEEAGIDAATASRATRESELYVERAHADGLQRETLFAFDLVLDAGDRPANRDGEAVEHRLVTLSRAAALIAADQGPDVVTIDASLVILDCLMRHGAIARDVAQWDVLDGLRRARP